MPCILKIVFHWDRIISLPSLWLPPTPSVLLMLVVSFYLLLLYTYIYVHKYINLLSIFLLFVFIQWNMVLEAFLLPCRIWWKPSNSRWGGQRATWPQGPIFIIGEKCGDRHVISQPKGGDKKKLKCYWDHRWGSSSILCREIKEYQWEFSQPAIQQHFLPHGFKKFQET